MSKASSKREKRQRRHKRVRSKIKGTSAVPRLSVFRSNKHVWAQLIDDVSGKTIAAASDLEAKDKSKPRRPTGSGLRPQASEKTKDKKTTPAEKVGELIAKKALEKKITSAVFDRGGYKYHGVVKAVAEGARKGGLKL